MHEVKVLCAADLHLGRRSSRLPALESGARLSPAEAWLELVERAKADRVDLVVLAGDVVDQSNRSFEAWGPLQRGVRALKTAGIPVVAVAGNHDHDTLHDLAADVGDDNLVVLGRGGVWERWTLTDDDGEPLLHVDGWSFPDGLWRIGPDGILRPGLARRHDGRSDPGPAARGPGPDGEPVRSGVRLASSISSGHGLGPGPRPRARPEGSRREPRPYSIPGRSRHWTRARPARMARASSS